MKRFYKDVTVAAADQGWIVQLDGRPLKTQAGRPQCVPTAALAAMLADEWAAQGELIDPHGFRARDTADYALDVVAADPAALADKLVSYAETDTLCYRADPDEALHCRQQEVWEPLVAAVEAREGVRFHRVNGIVHRPQPARTLAALRDRLQAMDAFTLAALEQLVSLSASLCAGLAALEPGADGEAIWAAAELEESWQADLWGRDDEAQDRRDRRRADFLAAIAFARAARAA